MSGNESIEFKYSVPKSLIRICVWTIIASSGFLVAYHFYVPGGIRFGSKSPIQFWIAFIFSGVCVSMLLDNIFNLFMNKRVFLRLTAWGLQSYYLGTLAGILIIRLPIPQTYITNIKWSQIEEMRIKRKAFGRKEIIITFSYATKKRTRIMKHGITVSCSKCSADYIFQTIKTRLGT